MKGFIKLYHDLTELWGQSRLDYTNKNPIVYEKPVKIYKRIFMCNSLGEKTKVQELP